MKNTHKFIAFNFVAASALALIMNGCSVTASGSVHPTTTQPISTSANHKIAGVNDTVYINGSSSKARSTSISYTSSAKDSTQR